MDCPGNIGSICVVDKYITGLDDAASPGKILNFASRAESEKIMACARFVATRQVLHGDA